MKCCFTRPTGKSVEREYKGRLRNLPELKICPQKKLQRKYFCARNRRGDVYSLQKVTGVCRLKACCCGHSKTASDDRVDSCFPVSGSSALSEKPHRYFQTIVFSCLFWGKCFSPIFCEQVRYSQIYETIFHFKLEIYCLYLSHQLRQVNQQSPLVSLFGFISLLDSIYECILHLCILYVFSFIQCSERNQSNRSTNN